VNKTWEDFLTVLVACLQPTSAGTRNTPALIDTAGD
jgi:hypothetical protein